MGDDLVIHFASNSSNDQSLPTKIAKLEARMVGKGSSSSTTTPQPNSWSAPAKFDNVAQPASVSSDSDDDDNGVEFLIQANTQKRRKLEDDNSSTSFEHVETAADTVKKIAENTDASKVGSDVNKRKQSRGRGQTNSGRTRGSRDSDQKNKSQAVSASNGQLENSYQKLQDGLPKEQLGHDGQIVLEEEFTSLRAKVVALEEELKKSRQEASDYQHQCQQLEKELKDLKDYEQQTKPKLRDKRHE